MTNSLEIIYEETRMLIFICEQNNYFEEKKILEDSLSYSCTFGEILSNISTTIKEILQKDKKYSDVFMNKAYEILRLLNSFH